MEENKWDILSDGRITLTVTSDGTSGERWIQILEGAGYQLSIEAKRILLSETFAPTDGVVYYVTIFPGGLFKNGRRSVFRVRTEAEKFRFLRPPLEVACLLRMYLTDKDIEQLGLWFLVVMHDPIRITGGTPFLLCPHRDEGGNWFSVRFGYPSQRFGGDNGFVFISPPT